MSSAKSMSLTRRAEAYRRQIGAKQPSPRQRRRLDHKSRKRFGFVSWAWYASPVSGRYVPDPEVLNELKFRARPTFAGSLLDPKAIITIEGTGA
jgi:hypothetical protein